MNRDESFHGMWCVFGSLCVGVMYSACSCMMTSCVTVRPFDTLERFRYIISLDVVVASAVRNNGLFLADGFTWMEPSFVATVVGPALSSVGPVQGSFVFWGGSRILSRTP